MIVIYFRHSGINQINHPLVLKQGADTALKLLLLGIRRKQLQIDKGAVQFFSVIDQLLIHTGRLAQRNPDHITVYAEKQFCFREYIRLIQIKLLIHFPNAFRSECIFPSHLFASILKTGIICW